MINNRFIKTEFIKSRHTEAEFIGNRRINAKKWASAAFSVILTCSMAITAVAVPPYDSIPEGMSRETYDRMMDNVIEWDEVDTLVRYYNPTYSRIYNSAHSGIADINAAYGSFVMDAKDQLDQIDATLDELAETQKLIQKLPGNLVPDVTAPGNFISKNEAIAKLEQSMQAAEAGRDQLTSAVNQLGRKLKSSEKSLEIKLSPLRKQMVSVIEGLLISYEELRVSHTMVSQQVKLYETLGMVNENLGRYDMATDADIALAKSNLETAKNSLQKLENGMNSLAGSIGLQLGWSAANIPEIAELPLSDIHIPSREEYEAEKDMAIKGNPEVIASGKASGGSGYEYFLRDMTENEAIARLSSKLDVIFAEVEKQKLLYESSLTALEKAELTRASNQKKYELGLIGRGEYEGLQMSCISYEASARLAAINLLRAVNNYRWAMQGIVGVD